MEELQRAGQSEEAGGAYKDIDQVVAATEAVGMSRRVAHFMPSRSRFRTGCGPPAARTPALRVLCNTP